MTMMVIQVPNKHPFEEFQFIDGKWLILDENGDVVTALNNSVFKKLYADEIKAAEAENVLAEEKIVEEDSKPPVIPDGGVRL